MSQQTGIEFLEKSFISSLLENQNITDISYNGDSIFYMDNCFGRQKSDVSITEQQAKDFIRQIANISEKQFSYQNPQLDISFGRYRINAVHSSIGRKNGEHCLTFSIRITKSSPVINDKSTFLNAKLRSLLLTLIQSKISIVIGGLTGTGKTELQKYLITIMDHFTRLIIIDNVLELDNLLSTNLDINIWQVDERNENSSMQSLVRNALRCNPDWLIVSESRGKEMLDVLNSALTGHPIITTIHSLDVNSMPKRMARMVMMNDKNQDFQMILDDIHYIFRFYVYLKMRKNEKGEIDRYVYEISYFDEKGFKHLLYVDKDGHINSYYFPPDALELLTYKNNKEFIEYFVEKK